MYSLAKQGRGCAISHRNIVFQKAILPSDVSKCLYQYARVVNERPCGLASMANERLMQDGSPGPILLELGCIYYELLKIGCSLYYEYLNTDKLNSTGTCVCPFTIEINLFKKAWRAFHLTADMLKCLIRVWCFFSKA